LKRGWASDGARGWIAAFLNVAFAHTAGTVRVVTKEKRRRVVAASPDSYTDSIRAVIRAIRGKKFSSKFGVLRVSA
jgi:hypothetical protein